MPQENIHNYFKGIAKTHEKQLHPILSISCWNISFCWGGF